MSLSGDARVPGSSKGIVSPNLAVFFFSELKFAHEQERANTPGVLKLNTTTNNNNTLIWM